MNKKQAMRLFKVKTETELAGELNISRQAVNQWPDKLPQKTADWITGVAVRKRGIKL